MTNSISTKIELNKGKELKEKLEQEGFSFREVDYAFWSARGNDVIITFYKSGKMLFQGKNAEKYHNSTLNAVQAPPTSAKPKYESWIGTDESGKGDYFGPLVVAGVLVNRENIDKLASIKVRDSKTMSDSEIKTTAKKIKTCSEFSIVTINPPKYNELYDKLLTACRMGVVMVY